MELLFDNAPIQVYVLHTSGHIQVSYRYRVMCCYVSCAVRDPLTSSCLVFVSRFALRFIRPDPRGRVTDPVGDVVSFIHSFEEKYGRSHPVFYQGTYSQVG